MYKLTKDQFNKQGFMPKKVEKTKFDTVLSYLLNFDRSNGYRHGLTIAHSRNLLISNILGENFNFTELPAIKAQYEFVFDNLPKFKQHFIYALTKPTG